MFNALKDYYYNPSTSHLAPISSPVKELIHNSPLRGRSKSPFKGATKVTEVTAEEDEAKFPSFRVNGYSLYDCIGRGNFGDVYKAKSPVGQTVAIKAINLEESDDDIPILLQEINFLRNLRHKNITNWYTTFTQNVTMYIAMELCENGSCSDMLKYHGHGIQELDIGYITKNVLEGLSYLHSLNIIHRDIKAANILITKTGIIKLSDFGVSGQMIGKKGRNTFVGTPFWMAPEIVCESDILVKDREMLEERLVKNGLTKSCLSKLWKKKIEKNPTQQNGSQIVEQKEEQEKMDAEIEYNEKVDIWSLGITVIELYEGAPPNSKKDPMKALFDVPKREPPSLDLSASFNLREFIVGCLVKDPLLRPTANELKRFKFIFKNKIKQESFVFFVENKENCLECKRPNGNMQMMMKRLKDPRQFVEINKKKQKRPKFELNENNVNHGPRKDLQWDLGTSPFQLLSSIQLSKSQMSIQDLNSKRTVTSRKKCYKREGTTSTSNDSAESKTVDLTFVSKSGQQYVSYNSGKLDTQTSPLVLSAQQKSVVAEVVAACKQLSCAESLDAEREQAIASFEGAVEEMERLGLFT